MDALSTCQTRPVGILAITTKQIFSRSFRLCSSLQIFFILFRFRSNTELLHSKWFWWSQSLRFSHTSPKLSKVALIYLLNVRRKTFASPFRHKAQVELFCTVCCVFGQKCISLLYTHMCSKSNVDISRQVVHYPVFVSAGDISTFEEPLVASQEWLLCFCPQPASRSFFWFRLKVTGRADCSA